MDLKRWLFISTALFCGGLIIGFLLPDSAAKAIEDSFRNIAGNAASKQGFSLFILIFFNNALAVSASFFFSPILLILPVVSIVMNGALVTVVGRLALQDHSPLYLAAGILPHGIIEIPAYLIGQAAAICFGFTIIRSVLNTQQRSAAGPIIRRCLSWLALAIILLVPAALIEAFVTPRALTLFK